MAAEAVNLYFNLVIVLGRKIHSFPLKATVVSWGKSFILLELLPSLFMARARYILVVIHFVC